MSTNYELNLNLKEKIFPPMKENKMAAPLFEFEGVPKDGKQNGHPNWWGISSCLKN